MNFFHYIISTYILENVRKVVSETYMLLKSKLTSTLQSMALFLANKDTEYILFKPVKVRKQLFSLNFLLFFVVFFCRAMMTTDNYASTVMTKTTTIMMMTIPTTMTVKATMPITTSNNNSDCDDDDEDGDDDDNRELKQATFLSDGRKPEVNIWHIRTVISPRFSNYSSVPVKRYLTIRMW